MFSVYEVWGFSKGFDLGQIRFMLLMNDPFNQIQINLEQIFVRNHLLLPFHHKCNLGIQAGACLGAIYKWRHAELKFVTTCIYTLHHGITLGLPPQPYHVTSFLNGPSDKLSNVTRILSIWVNFFYRQNCKCIKY